MLAARTLRRSCTLLLALAAPGSALTAQQFWNDGTGKGEFRIEALKPLLKAEEAQFLTGSLIFGGTVRAGNSFRLEGELPIARAGFTAGSVADGSAVRVGNLYLGFRTGREEATLSGQVGVTLPTAGDPADEIELAAGEFAVLSDIDRFESFTSHVLTLHTALEYRSVSESGILLGAKLGTSLLVSTRDTSGDKVELFADYGVRLGYEGAAVRATVGLSGRGWITESGMSFSERTVHQLSGVLELIKGRIRPGALVRIPLDDDSRELIRGVIGVGVTIAF